MPLGIQIKPTVGARSACAYNKFISAKIIIAYKLNYITNMVKRS